MILIIGGAYQGKADFAKTLAAEDHLLLNVHEIIRAGLAEEKSRDEAEATLWAQIDDDSVLTADEVGCGVVPMDAFERQYRETTGRILCGIAKKADTVYRDFIPSFFNPAYRCQRSSAYSLFL